MSAPASSSAVVAGATYTPSATSTSKLAVAVSVEPSAAPVRHEEFLRIARAMSSTANEQPSATAERYYQQQ